MQRDPRDVWPDDVPIGTFDIQEGTIANYPGATAHLMFVCPGGRRCGILLGPVPVPKAPGRDLFVWGWDGNYDQPTLTPSINCRAVKDDGSPAGGCGWHGFITAGEMR
jgi:Family of unknown function (DUF6527)